MGPKRAGAWPFLRLLFWLAWFGSLGCERLFLNSPASFAVFDNPDLIIGEEQEVLLAVRVKPQTFTGSIIHLDGSLNDTQNFRLSIALIDGFMEVDLYDEKGAKILKKPFSQTILNTSIDHQINVKLDFKKRTLVFRVDSRGEASHEISKQFPVEGTRVKMVFGSQNSKSIVGCLELIVLSTRNVNLENGKTRKVAEKDVSACGLEGKCLAFDCGQGKCLDLEVPTCDCFGTQRSGPNCKNDPTEIFIDSDKEQGVWYSPVTDDQRPKKIAMQFKFDPSEEVEGVLLAANLSAQGALRLFVVGNKGRLELGQVASLNFTLDSIKGFHSLLIDLELGKNRLKLTADNQTPIELEWRAFDQEIRFTQIAFGQSVNQAAARDVGFTGCLRHVFVDHLDILDRLTINDPRITSYTPLMACEERPLPARIGLWPPMGAESKNGGNSARNRTDFVATRTTEGLVVFSERDPSHADIFPYGAKEKKPSTRRTDCENADATRCRHQSRCYREHGAPKCECLPGNVGRFCQFSTLPRSCAEAWRLGLPRGATRIDLDGSGPLDVSVANCIEGKTEVIHDMPPLTPIRDAAFNTHSLFVLSYRDFSESKLSSLIEQSAECSQAIRYDCNGAPLNFAQNHTWFHTAFKNGTVHRLGDIKGGYRCDARSPATDEGILRDFDAGVTRVVALHSPGDIDGRMSVGELQCRGFAKSDGIRFETSATFPTVKWRAEHLSFHFRTAQETTILATLTAEPRNRVEIRLERGRFVVFSWKHGEVEEKLVVETQHQLNDTDWHMLRVEVMDEEMLLTVDGVNRLLGVKQNALPRAVLWLGDEHGGLEGCLRSLSVDNRPINLADFIKKSTGIFEGCADHCAATTCQNEAKCVEDFGKQRAKCICKYPHIHSGDTCETNLNHNSDVSFHGGFLRYSQLDANPLLDQIVLSARTDQPHALLYFAHDHNYNFVQIHISDEVNVTLTLNNRENVFSCTVTARPRREFSDMTWIQIVVAHHTAASTLTVDEDSCSISAERVLSPTVVNQFHLTKAEIDLVAVPVGLYAPTNPEPLLYVFVGGIERDTHSQRNEKRLAPVYQSSIPDLLGCLRGLRIGSQVVDLRDTKLGYRSDDPNLVRNGCQFGCNRLKCQHGGHCSIGWRNYDPTVTEKTRCDCTRTSYAGPTCALDDGIRFDGHSVFEFAIGEILKTVIVEGEAKFPQLFKFSFSARLVAHSARQHLATIRFREPLEKTRFEIILRPNGTINVGAVMPNRTQVLNFAGNFTDGHRHFVVVQFSKRHATVVMIDSLRKDFDVEENRNFDLYSADVIEIGGVPEGIPGPPNSRRRRQAETGMRLSFNYEGCISNLVVDYQRSRLTFEPFALLDNAHTHSSKVRLLPHQKAERISCAKFQEPDALPSYQNTVEFPNWSTNFARRDFTEARPLDDLQNDEPSSSWWLIGLLVAISLILLVLVVLCLWLCCCRKKDSPDAKRSEETMPLRSNSFSHSFPGPQQPNHKAKNNFHVPPPDTELDEKRMPSWTGTTLSGYHTAQESPSWAGSSLDEDFDRTLTEGMDEDADIPHADHGQELPPPAPSPRQTPANFGKSLPTRQGSFRNNRESPLSPLFSAPPPPSRSPVPVATPSLSPTSLAKL